MRDAMVGDKLDQYQLDELLARSGMASIFKATDTLTSSTVALKVPYLQFESDIVFHERFNREEKIGIRLEHPYVVKVLTPSTRLECIWRWSLRKASHCVRSWTNRSASPLKERCALPSKCAKRWCTFTARGSFTVT